MLTHHGSAGDDPTDVVSLRASKGDRSAHRRDPLSLFAQLYADPMVVAFQLISVDVQSLPAQPEVFDHGQVHPAVEVEIVADGGSAVEFVCNAHQKGDVDESPARAIHQ